MRFEALAETLLKGGIAPRHVRRYIRELAEHLEDLTAQQRADGYDVYDARSRARARLGDDSELAHAMFSRQKGLFSPHIELGHSCLADLIHFSTPLNE